MTYADEIINMTAFCKAVVKLTEQIQKIMDLLAGNCLFETGADVLNYVQPEIP